MRKPGAVAVAVASLAAVAAGTAAQGTESGGAAASLSAEPVVASYVCADRILASANAVCGNVTVPLDHSKPTGKMIKIAISVVAATASAKDYQGILLVNPGGPGSTGLASAAAVARLLPREVAATYDIIGFDPRGVGRSNPRMSCDTNFGQGPRPDYTPTSGAKGKVSKPEKAWRKRSEKYGATCQAKFGDLLKNMTSVDVVRDLDLMRQGFRADKISFYGFSYGSYLAQLYATMYPTHTRRMVLDGVTDPATIGFAGTKTRPAGLEKTIGAFWSWTARHHKTYGLGKTAAKVEALYYRELVKLRKSPRGHLGPAEWNDTFHQPAYGWPNWAQTAAAWRAWAKGDAAPMTALWRSNAGVGNDNFRAVYLAVRCTDAAWPREYAVLRKQAFTSAASSPFAAWHTMWGTGGTCLRWPVKGGKPKKIDGTKAPAILLVSSTIDPATPYAGAIEARQRFPRSRLVADVGTAKHGASLAGNSCVDAYVVAYLRNGTLPARKAGNGADAKCKKTPEPKP